MYTIGVPASFCRINLSNRRGKIRLLLGDEMKAPFLLGHDGVMGVGLDSEGKCMGKYLHEQETHKRQNNRVYPA
jgi:hypothetical protein